MNRRAYRDGYDAIEWGPMPETQPRAERSRPAVHIIGDTLPDAVQSMADGRFYTSKSALRATYRPSGNPNGHSFVEVGNDAARFRPHERSRPDKHQIRETLQRAEARYERGERAR